MIDGHPAALGWLGSVRGNRGEALGVEQFGQTGTIGDLYRHHGIDANAIIDAAESLTVGAPVRQCCAHGARPSCCFAVAQSPIADA